jgi:serine/threonine protein kinase
MLKPGDSFERYTIEAAIGQGGMGSVYRAHDTRLGRRVALKVLADRVTSHDASARLVREARAAAALDHPNAVAIFDVGELDGAPYIVMELVEGRTLRAAIGEQGLPLRSRVAHLADIGRALGSAHKRGLIHRDVKPENVMIRDDGMVKVLDFGIARRSGGEVDPAGPTQTLALPTLTIDGAKLGTPVYMAPEQIRGDALDGRADQFSWGVVAYELLTGRLPWRGNDALAAMASALTDPVDRVALDAAAVPRPVQDVVLRALAKRADQRFASMDDAVRALEAAARGEAPPDEPPAGVTAAQRFSTEEVREVLGKAVEQQAAKQGSSKLGFDDLLAVAAEVGVDPDSLREASRALRARGQEKPQKSEEKSAPEDNAAQRDAWLRRRKLIFYRHAGIYAIVNAALLVLGLVLLGPFTPWWPWFIPALGWGIGLAIHGLTALTANEDDWAEQRERMQWWLDQRRRRHEERMARSHGGRGPSRELRGRIEAGHALAEDKLRVAADTGRDHRAAEEEAAAAEQRTAEGARRRR